MREVLYHPDGASDDQDRGDRGGRASNGRRDVEGKLHPTRSAGTASPPVPASAPAVTKTESSPFPCSAVWKLFSRRIVLKGGKLRGEDGERRRRLAERRAAFGQMSGRRGIEAEKLNDSERYRRSDQNRADWVSASGAGPR